MACSTSLLDSDIPKSSVDSHILEPSKSKCTKHKPRIYVEPKNIFINPKYKCIYCNEKHSSHFCKKYSRNEAFYDILVKERRCKNCLRQFHTSEKCFDSSICKLPGCLRKDKHSPSVCRHRFPKRVFPNPYSNSFYPTNFTPFGMYNYPAMLNMNIHQPWSNSALPAQCQNSCPTKPTRTYSQETQTDEDHRYSSYFTSFLHSDSSSVNDKFVSSRILAYVKLPCSQYCKCRIKNFKVSMTSKPLT